MEAILGGHASTLGGRAREHFEQTEKPSVTRETPRQVNTEATHKQDCIGLPEGEVGPETQERKTPNKRAGSEESVKNIHSQVTQPGVNATKFPPQGDRLGSRETTCAILRMRPSGSGATFGSHSPEPREPPSAGGW